MSKRLLFLVIFLAVILAACSTTDPRNQADADRTRALTAQDVADREQARALQLQKTQALAAEQAAASARLIRWVSIAGSLGLAGVILAVCVGVSWAAVGTGKAAVRLANTRAGLIPLAESTRQFPLLLHYVGKGRYSLANPNTGGVYELDTRRDPDRQLIAAAGAVDLAGAVAREARRSHDPAGVAVIQPAISEAAKNDNL